MSDWDHPLPFIILENDSFQLDIETVKKLQIIKKPLVSVCIVGNYKTGKSYLMNRLIGHSTGFPLGNTFESKTKGIWVWYKNHPEDEKKGFLVMDTEGLNDPFKDDEAYDIKIFSLSILLSGTLIYNVVGKIDNSLVDKLHFITEISKYVLDKTNAEDDFDFDTLFPHFVLVCRDKILELIIEGKNVTADEYMERLMLTANKKATSGREKGRNEIKLKLRRYFSKRKCFFFERPASNEEDMRRLDELKDENLNPQFTNESEKFCNYVIDQSSVKKVTTTQSMTGQILVQLSQIYIDAINNQSVPGVGSVVDLFASTQNNELIQECVSKYVRFMSNLMLPLSNEEFELAHGGSYEYVVGHFANNVFLSDNYEYFEKLRGELRNEYTKFTKANYGASKDFCTSTLDNLFKSIKEKIGNGGYIDYVKDFQELKEKYNAVPNKGIMETVILDKFVNNLQNDQKSILLADQMISENERKIEEETLRREEAQRNYEIQQEKLKQEQIQQQALIQNHEEQIEILISAHKDEIKEATEKSSELMENRLKEQERLMQENFKEEANQMEQKLKQEKIHRQTMEKDLHEKFRALEFAKKEKIDELKEQSVKEKQQLQKDFNEKMTQQQQETEKNEVYQQKQIQALESALKELLEQKSKEQNELQVKFETQIKQYQLKSQEDKLDQQNQIQALEVEYKKWMEQKSKEQKDLLECFHVQMKKFQEISEQEIKEKQKQTQALESAYKKLLDQKSTKLNELQVKFETQMKQYQLKSQEDKLDQQNQIQALEVEHKKSIEQKSKEQKDLQERFDVEMKKFQEISEQAIKEKQEQIEVLISAHKDEIKEVTEKSNELMENRLKEQERLMQENFKEEANQLEQKLKQEEIHRQAMEKDLQEKIRALECAKMEKIDGIMKENLKERLDLQKDLNERMTQQQQESEKKEIHLQGQIHALKSAHNKLMEHISKEKNELKETIETQLRHLLQNSEEKSIHQQVIINKTNQIFI